MNVLIDPGHDDKNPGAIVNGIQEKNLNMIYATMLLANIAPDFTTEKQAILTRTPKGHRNLSSRARESEGKDAMVSIHCNAATVPEARGLEIFLVNRNLCGDPLSGSKENDLAYSILNKLQPIYKHYDAKLRRPVIKPDTDSAHGELKLLREARCPACLIEIGFMTNEKDMKMMQNPEFIFEWTFAVATGIDKFVNGE